MSESSTGISVGFSSKTTQVTKFARLSIGNDLTNWEGRFMKPI